jgi:hypothetical protein
MPHQTSRRGERKRSAVFTCAFGAGALLVDRECVSTSCLGVGMWTRTDRLPSAAILTSPPRVHPGPFFSVPRRDGVYADLELREFERQTLRTLSVSPLMRSPQEPPFAAVA